MRFKKVYLWRDNSSLIGWGIKMPISPQRQKPKNNLMTSVHNAHNVKQDISVCKNDQYRIRRCILLLCIIYTVLQLHLEKSYDLTLFFQGRPIRGTTISLHLIQRYLYISVSNAESQQISPYIILWTFWRKIQNLECGTLFSFGFLAPERKQVLSHFSL